MTNKSIVGIFNDEDQLVHAMEALKENQVKIKEVYTPYPIHHVFQLLNRTTTFTWWAFGYGAFAVISVISFLYYTSVVDWPINFGGKPFNAFPSFIVITIILTILTITILSLFTFSYMARVYPGKPAKIFDHRATDDKFVIVIDKEYLKTDHSVINNLLQTHGASEVFEKETEY
ncbi:MAG: DUF3341 domain-containing protein [Bacteroidales bacterium]